MRKLFAKFWKDDAGIVAFEYLLVATIVGLALVVGLSSVSAALNVELSELANAILSLNQAYSVASQSSATGAVGGVNTGPDPVGNVIYGHSVVTAPGIATGTNLSITP